MLLHNSPERPFRNNKKLITIIINGTQALLKHGFSWQLFPFSCNGNRNINFIQSPFIHACFDIFKNQIMGEIKSRIYVTYYNFPQGIKVCRKIFVYFHLGKAQAGDNIHKKKTKKNMPLKSILDHFKSF